MSRVPPASPLLPENPDPRAAPAMLRRFGNTVDPKFHLTVCDCGVFTVNSFDTIDEMVAKMKTYNGRDVHVFAHCGFRMQIAPGTMPFMVLPDAERVPLFDIPEELQVADDGYVGVPIPITQIEQASVTRSQRNLQLRDTAIPTPTQPVTPNTPIFGEGEDNEEHEEE